MGRKVFISFLGADYYEAFKYGFDETTNIDYTTNESTPFIQEALLEYLYSDTNPEKWKNDEEHKVCILCTDDAISYNWLANKKFKDLPKGQKQYTEDDGLKARLHKQNIKCEECGKDGDPCYIEDNKDNMWKIFAKLDGLVDNDDELYLDVTHGFRYMPMMMLVFANYVKFTKKVTIKHIFYGDKGNKNIIDLLPLSNLQDWTYATATYLENGNANSLIKLAKEEGKNDFANALKDVMLDFQTCRSIPIVKGTHFKELVDKLPDFGSDVSKIPFNNLLGQIKKEIDAFKHDENTTIDNDNVNNGYKAAIWCFNNQLYQQAITILRENIVTDAIVAHNQASTEQIDWKNGYGASKEKRIDEIKQYLSEKCLKNQLLKKNKNAIIDFMKGHEDNNLKNYISKVLKKLESISMGEVLGLEDIPLSENQKNEITSFIHNQFDVLIIENNEYEDKINRLENVDEFINNQANDWINDNRITNGDLEHIKGIWNAKNFEESDRNKRTDLGGLRHILNQICDSRNDFNHAGFTYGTSNDYPDGWGNTKIIEEVKKAFVELINLKFAGKYEMTEKNGFPYIKEK